MKAFLLREGLFLFLFLVLRDQLFLAIDFAQNNINRADYRN